MKEDPRAKFKEEFDNEWKAEIFSPYEDIPLLYSPDNLERFKERVKVAALLRYRPDDEGVPINWFAVIQDLGIDYTYIIRTSEFMVQRIEGYMDRLYESEGALIRLYNGGAIDIMGLDPATAEQLPEILREIALYEERSVSR